MKNKHSIGAVLVLEAIVLVLVFCFDLLMISGVSGLEKSFAYFIDVPSLLLIVLVVAPALFVSGMGRDFLNAFSVGKREYSLRQLKRCLEAVQMVQKMIICGTAMSGIISVVMILWMLFEKPELDETWLGPCLAVSILVVFYAVILEFFLIPVKANVQNTITDLMDVEDEEA